MVQTCSRCSRANPTEAAYCYFDGFVLAGAGGGPLAMGAQTFTQPFVFPSGRNCRSFDELSVACQEEWESARDLLQQGYLESFLGGLGRVDLALAAREAARFPDHDRGLDQLLGKFPSDVLADPSLRVDPAEVSLGQLAGGQDRSFDLHLENQGMRLLYGSVSCGDAGWLGLGDAPGTADKMFQCTHDLTLPVRIRGDRLRAGNKPLEARLLVESNGGTTTVVVRAEVPVKPFSAGVLAGARSPRQVAEKAKAHPREAAALFEDGSVAGWYKENGWTYPVQGPSAAGMAAVQQFFEALGLTAPPKVEISERAVALEGSPGDRLSYALQVRTDEKRPVYAHAVSNQSWIEVSRPKLNGRVAVINFAVPAVPNRPGETLTAKLTVQSNGTQRFVVPVTLQVAAGFDFTQSAPTPNPGEVESVVLTGEVLPPPAEPPAAPSRARPRRVATRKPRWLHALPAALLVLALLGVGLIDLVSPHRPGSGGSSGPSSGGDGAWTYELDDGEPQLGVKFNDQNRRFGLVMLKEHDPKDPNQYKRLTFKADGSSSNTCIWADGAEYLFGKRPQGYWYKGQHAVELRGRIGYKSVMMFTQQKIRVTQHVEIVPGEQSRLLDTCLVWYTVENADTLPHKVGLRVMLDTFIGTNDGVPFVIPGQSGLLTDLREFSQKEIPDYVEALEKPDIKNPGTVVHLGLKGFKLPGIDLDPLTRLLICRWPGNSEQLWELRKAERQPVGKTDSCVFLYWDAQKMNPKDRRDLAFTYGLGKIALGEDGSELGLTAGGSFRPGDEFTVTAYVKNPKEGQKVSLHVPRGLSLGTDETAEKTVDKGGDYTQVAWRVRSGEPGSFVLQAESGGSRARYPVRIKQSSLFGGD